MNVPSINLDAGIFRKKNEVARIIDRSESASLVIAAAKLEEIGKII